MTKLATIHHSISKLAIHNHSSSSSLVPRPWVRGYSSIAVHTCSLVCGQLLIGTTVMGYEGLSKQVHMDLQRIPRNATGETSCAHRVRRALVASLSHVDQIEARCHPHYTTRCRHIK